MRKLIFILFIALAMTFTFISCDSDNAATTNGEPKGTVEVNLVAATEKSLTSEVNKQIKYWEFMARPDFTLNTGENVYGVVSYWRDIPAITTPESGVIQVETNIGRYTSGSWLFEVRALNENHKVVAVGSTRQIVREGIQNTVNVVVYTDRADGTHGESADSTSATAGSTSITPFSGNGITLSTNTNYGTGNGAFSTTRYGKVKIGLIINRLDADLSDIRLSVYSQKISKQNTAGDVNTEVAVTAMNTWTVVEAGGNLPTWFTADAGRLAEYGSTVGAAKTYYEIEVPNRDAGPYVYTIVVEGKDDINANNEWVTLGGQAFDVLVIGGETTYVTGTLLANDYVIAGLKVTAPGSIIGTINGKQYIRGTAGTPVTLSFITDTANSAEPAVKYFWYVNGVQQENVTGQLTFDCPKDSSNAYLFGIYRISCSPTGSLGSIGNATIDVIFNPEEGPNVGEFNWDIVGL